MAGSEAPRKEFGHSHIFPPFEGALDGTASENETDFCVHDVFPEIMFVPTLCLTLLYFFLSALARSLLFQSLPLLRFTHRCVCPGNNIEYTGNPLSHLSAPLPFIQKKIQSPYNAIRTLREADPSFTVGFLPIP